MVLELPMALEEWIRLGWMYQRGPGYQEKNICIMIGELPDLYVGEGDEVACI